MAIETDSRSAKKKITFFFLQILVWFYFSSCRKKVFNFWKACIYLFLEDGVLFSSLPNDFASNSSINVQAFIFIAPKWDRSTHTSFLKIDREFTGYLEGKYDRRQKISPPDPDYSLELILTVSLLEAKSLKLRKGHFLWAPTKKNTERHQGNMLHP